MYSPSIDDKVVYVGTKFAKELSGKMGFVISEIKNEKGKYVVEFGDESFIVNESSLAPFVATSPKEKEEVIVSRNRRRYSEDEE